jgi:putative hydrolase of the HAD superfamily
VPLALFDLDNTLIRRQQVLTPVAEQFCAAHRLGADAVPHVAEAFRERTGIAIFARLRSEFDLASTAPELWGWYVDAIVAAVNCPAPVLDGLQQLRDCGWNVGIVTNGATDIQVAKLRSTGIDQVVDTVVISEDVGTRKPDPAIFHAAATRCGQPLADGWMTGDNPTTDIGGAQGVGLRTIWIAAGRTWTHDAPPAEHAVDDVLAAIAHLLAQ